MALVLAQFCESLPVPPWTIYVSSAVSLIGVRHRLLQPSASNHIAILTHAILPHARLTAYTRFPSAVPYEAHGFFKELYIACHLNYLGTFHESVPCYVPGNYSRPYIKTLVIHSFCPRVTTIHGLLTVLLTRVPDAKHN